jgi:3D (Asp-Asp-Asp) domain-containing protein
MILSVLLLVATAQGPQYLGTYRVTAYCPCKICTGRWSRHHRTKTGKPARGNLVAVDPRFVRLGSAVRVQGVGRLRCEDTGSAIKGRRLDVLLPTHQQAKRFGVRRLRVWRTTR